MSRQLPSVTQKQHPQASLHAKVPSPRGRPLKGYADVQQSIQQGSPEELAKKVLNTPPRRTKGRRGMGNLLCTGDWLLDSNTRVEIGEAGHSGNPIDISAGLCGRDAIVIHDWGKRIKIPIGFARDIAFRPKVSMTYTYSANDHDSGIIRLHEFMRKRANKNLDMIISDAEGCVVFLRKGSFMDIPYIPSHEEILAQAGNFFDFVALAPSVEIKFELMFSEYELGQCSVVGSSAEDGTEL